MEINVKAFGEFNKSTKIIFSNKNTADDNCTVGYIRISIDGKSYNIELKELKAAITAFEILHNK